MSGNAAAAARRKTARPRAKHSATPAESPVMAASVELETTPAAPASVTPVDLTPVELAPVTAVSKSEPTRDDVARLAYSYWEARGCQGGSAEEDWLRAEVEIRATSVATA
ncbi:MAG TPA: DUF2934 domain-containing protein [Bryobacteraceae bacterium]|nr:DUF2934 domain-containing protein [Bryobacteraceae bacterium]